MEYLSKERYDQIVAELNTLTDVEYPRIKDALDEARAQGDLSENALSKVKDEKGMKRVEKFLRLDVCPDCGGTRLSDLGRGDPEPIRR